MQKNKLIMWWTASSLVIFYLLAYLFPVFFQWPANRSASIWFLVTNTADIYASLLMVIIVTLLVALKKQTTSAKIKTFLLLVGSTCVVAGGIAVVNERVIKATFQEPRPSHLVLKERGIIQMDLKQFYALKKKDRQNYVSYQFNRSPEKLADINNAIIEHWIHEAGSSFPSGHTTNAFFLATLLAGIITTYYHKKILIAAPFVWAMLVGLSRLALGVHASLDIAVGATIGAAVALVFMSVLKRLGKCINYFEL